MKGDGNMNITDLEKRTGFSFPADQLTAICYHSSFQPQDPVLLKRNKEYIQWGHSIINAACAIYLFQNHKDQLSAEQISTQSNIAYRCVEDAIFANYNLEDFVIKSNGEINTLHPDIASKLVVLIYQLYGFIDTYNFLLPFLSRGSSDTDVDYKTLIQEYAQAMKLSPIYEVLDTTGPDHEKKYTCKVSIGKMAAIAEAIGKKSAQKEAAKQFAIKYKVKPLKKQNRMRDNLQIRTLSVQRQKDIEAAEMALLINPRFISDQQMDEALIHSSYLNEHRNLSLTSNVCISVVGAQILSMLCAEYIFSNYDMTQITLVKERGVLLQEDNLSKSISDTSIKYLLRSGSGENDKARSRFKVAVIKSVIGFMGVNSISNNSIPIYDFIKKYANSLFSKSSKDKILDYRSFLQDIVQNYNWSYSASCELREHHKNNSDVFISTITIQGPNWEEIGTGAGNSKVEATNKAAKNILKDLVSHCSADKDIEASILRMLNPELLCLYEAKKDHIIAPDVSKTEDPTLLNAIKTPIPITKKLNIPKQSSKGEMPMEITFDCCENILYICKGTLSCKEKEHDVVSLTGILSSLNRHPVKIPIKYCKDCKEFSIDITEYEYYQSIYGILLGNISIRKSAEYSGSHKGLAEESILYICGYTVNQVDNLSDEQRRLILGNLMDRGILTKLHIIENLQFFINSSMYRYNMREANQKWTNDLAWVRTYDIDKRRKYIMTQ